MFNSSSTGGCSPPAGEMIYPASHLHFRDLRAEEVIVRPGETRNNRVKVFLYKDARSDRRILNESVGELNWQSDFFEQHGMLFCKVGIRNPETGEWIWKADTGSESNIEAEKGLASDAFKRACFAFGIGESLYSTPDVWINLTEKDMFQGKLCQTFRVSAMTIKDGHITTLTIVDKWNNERYSYNRNANPNIPVQKEHSTVKEEYPVAKDATTEYKYLEEPLDPDLAISEEEWEKMCPSKPTIKISRNEMIKEFCSHKKTEPGVDLRQLKRFYNWYTSPDKNDPSKSKVETFKNPIPEQMWEEWLKKNTKWAF